MTDVNTDPAGVAAQLVAALARASGVSPTDPALVRTAMIIEATFTHGYGEITLQIHKGRVKWATMKLRTRFDPAAADSQAGGREGSDPTRRPPLGETDQLLEDDRRDVGQGG